MKRYWFRAAATALLFFIALPASAGLPFRPTTRLYMGISSPVAPQEFKDIHLSGWNIGGAIGKSFGERVELSLDGSYNAFSFDIQGYLNTLELKDQDEFESSADGGDASILTLFLHLKTKFPPQGDQRFVPYLFAEAGFFHFSQNEIHYWGPIGTDRSEPKSSKTALGAGAGIGLNIAVEEHVAIFMDIGLKAGFTDGGTTSFFPFRFGVTFN
ncbi:MAG TPA: outer membrane beta-barrel protein [bacterium]|mgnify:CR=1 FL=1|nr:outer membrane beta-barrel protein [bacterium]